MDKIVVSVEKAIKIAHIFNRQNKNIVLVGGCFDILHVGHVVFLEKARQEGDILFVMLESDKAVQKLKGKGRPIHTQKQRAKILSAMQAVDYVILLTRLLDNTSYDTFVKKIKPAIIATTKRDPSRKHKERQAELIGCKVIDVVQRIPNASTTKLANRLALKNIL